jgi:hypothetical protein
MRLLQPYQESQLNTNAKEQTTCKLQQQQHPCLPNYAFCSVGVVSGPEDLWPISGLNKLISCC